MAGILENGEKSRGTLVLRNAGIHWIVSLSSQRKKRSEDPFHCDIHESMEETPASFALSFQLAPNDDSNPVKREGFCTCMKNGTCVGDTRLQKEV